MNAGASSSGSSDDPPSPNSQNQVTIKLDQAQVTSQVNNDIFNHFVEASRQDQPTSDQALLQQDLSNTFAKVIEKARNYQQELFEKAKEENLIAVLDTGSGKTLIACLLIRHVLAEELVERSKGQAPRMAVFMANSVHLVRQQALVLASNLTIAPAVLCGDDRTDVWKDKNYWQQLMQQNIPLVCTPAILQQCLDAASVGIDQMSLLVFDEAHHTKKNHPYSRIMRTHYARCAPEQRPRIFGMTASPIDSKGNVDMRAADLEQLLHSKIITTSDMSIMSFAPKPQDVIWTYSQRDQTQRSDLTEQLRPLCHFLDDARRGFAFADYAIPELGRWCVDQAWKYIFTVTEENTANVVKRYEQGQAYANIGDLERREASLKKLEQAHGLVQKFHVQPTQDLLSSKVLRLKDEISARFTVDPEIRGIVFIDQRLTALTLCDCFKKLNIPNLRPGALLGSSAENSVPKNHRETLDHFRAGLINLIFATSVADEGIDIPQCNLCIRFDLYKSPIQYMQSRGRARMTGSIYAHMIEAGDAAQQHAVQYAIDSDLYIKDFCQSLPPDRLLGRGTKLERLLTQDSMNKSFRTSVGAICDFGNCLLVLSKFAASLRHVGALEREVYEEYIDQEFQLFRYVVKLPCSFETQVKGARGEWRQNKQLAKRSAAFNCCFILRSKGYLDDCLRSKYRKIKPANLNALLAVSAEKDEYSMIVKPFGWKEQVGTIPNELFAITVHFIPSEKLQHPLAQVVLLTRSRLPDFPAFVTFVENNVPTTIWLERLEKALPVSPDDLRHLTYFTLDGVFLDVFNKQYEVDVSSMSYWLVPMVSVRNATYTGLTDVVDMQAVKAIQAGRIRWSSADDVTNLWTNRFICDPRSGRFRYFSRNVANGVRVFDPVPASVPNISQKSRNSIIDFSDSYWKASKKKFAAATWDPDQPVLHADLVSVHRNMLASAPEKESMQLKCFIAPQPLEVSRLYPNFAASCFVWPSIIHRIDSYMIALDGVEQLGLRGIPAELALEAFTKNKDADDLKNQTHLQGRHGMGKNYERLEFLGDSLLKMMTTITVFLRTNCDEEGMHCRRMEILCNQRLFSVSTKKHQLYKYIRATAFDRVTWYPEHLTLLKGRGAQTPPQPVQHTGFSQDLSKKTIADVSEALIGAAVVATQYLPARFDLGIKAITALVDCPDHTITSWPEIALMYKPPLWSLQSNDIVANNLAAQIKDRTGYDFRCPRLLRSAFTHSSDTNSTVPDLQRLEFLGDAILDWVSISWLFNTNPDRNPQWLTEHKMAMVSNKFLATLAVVLEFDKFITTNTISLHTEMSNYARRVRAMLADPGVSPDFWTDIDSPPKALSDLIESYIGAVFIDSAFNYNEIEKFFNQHILWFFKDISRYDGYASRHPTSYLHKKLSDDYKCRDFRVLSSEPAAGRIESSITAGVLVHGQVIAHAVAGSARVAKVKASKNALDVVEGMTREDFAEKFGCNCKAKRI